ncbi:EsaB/YukD family protein [Tengunoibacter tsumagoiensis]|uniref:Anaphase-promoting complex subunit 4-like WD40 domain-containing protein n=1 Tax=Tengunoibacter tsumagoiensis TaxID=2014871 RepID=A0A401ZY63_9CHLR|nr:EsaB/YukD family protein [Tengunoibacter tsumagoiensis]GCE11772.1 hypothetical protein KTT_16310 [Tengunoibacter tsumagoiensis]
MQKLEIYIQGVHEGMEFPVEVAADVPIKALIPAFVKMLSLPATDLFGKGLFYVLQRAENREILAEELTLLECAVRRGDRVVLEVIHEPVPELVGAIVESERPVRSRFLSADVDLHSSVTIADSEGWQVLSSGVAESQPQTGRGKVGRRAVLFGAVAILGLSGAGASYAAARLLAQNGGNPVRMPFQVGAVANKPGVTPPQAQVKLPTSASVLLTFAQHQQTVQKVAWSPGGASLLSGGDDRQALIWDLQGKVQQSVKHPAAITSLAWSPNGQSFVTAANTQVTFFDTQKGTPLARPVTAHQQTITSLSWTGQNQMQVVSAGRDKRAVIWNSRTYRPQATYTQHTAAIDGASWSADGQTVATASQGGFVRIWNAQNLQDLHGYYQDGQQPLQAVAFAPVGAILAVGGDDGVVRIWNALTCGNGGPRCMDMPQHLRVAQNTIRSLAWSPDGRFLAIGSNDGQFALWQIGQGQMALFTLKLPAPVVSIAWSPMGKQFATAVGKTVMLWQLQ